MFNFAYTQLKYIKINYKNIHKKKIIITKLNINEEIDNILKSLIYSLHYSQVFVETRSFVCHQSILDQKKTKSGPMQNKISPKEKRTTN